jgi:DNA recombination protein RmuC
MRPLARWVSLKPGAAARRTPKMSVPPVTMLGMDVAAVLIALVTLAAGFAAGWSIARTRSATGGATVAAERDAARAETTTLRGERDLLGDQLRAAEKAAADAVARLESERASATEKIALLEQAQVQLKEAFASLSQDALRNNNQQFLELADAKFKQAGAPLTETLGKVETQLREIEKERAGAQQALVQQIEFVRLTGEQLRHETSMLVSALRKPQARGQWGELHLRRAVEHAGMSDRCDFVEQLTVNDGERTMRPDLVVKLVGGKHIVVDAKVTLAAYLDAYDATDESVREERLMAHAKHLRQHVDRLAEKAYWAQFASTPEFVVLFVPGEAFLAPALERDPALLDDALGKRVHIVTPTTLVSTLRTVAYAWQQQALADNAREVFELGRELYKRIGTLGDHMDKLGRSLTGAVKAYNGTVGSLERQVLVTARKLNTLEVVDTPLDEPTPVEESVRPLGAAELVTAAEDGRAIVVLPAAGEEIDRPEDYGLVADRAAIDRAIS